MNEEISADPSGLVLSYEFSDFDAFADAARGWDVDFRQIDRGRFEARLTHVMTPSVILADCRLERRIEQRGAPPEGFRTFAILAEGGPELRWRGKTVTPEQLLIFPRGDQLDSVSNPGFHVFAFSVSEAALEDAAARRGLSSVDELFPGTDVISCEAVRMRRLREAASRLSRSAAGRPGLVKVESFRHALELDLLDEVLDAVDGGTRVDAKPTAFARNQALARALEVIAERAAEPVTVAEVERLSGVSGRTLRYAFEEAYGLSPKQYLQAYRLNRVRSELWGAKGAAAVSDAANAWGFWHLGQFARDYRRMFDELPSETVAARRSTASIY